MIHLYDKTTIDNALRTFPDSPLRALIADRSSKSSIVEFDPAHETEFLVIESGDTEQDVIDTIGFTPLVDPIEGVRFPHAAFTPFWDRMVSHKACYEILLTFGSTHALIILVDTFGQIIPELIDLCRTFSN